MNTQKAENNSLSTNQFFHFGSLVAVSRRILNSEYDESVIRHVGQTLKFLDCSSGRSVDLSCSPVHTNLYESPES
jgi:hypothetical protein